MKGRARDIVGQVSGRPSASFPQIRFGAGEPEVVIERSRAAARSIVRLRAFTVLNDGPYRSDPTRPLDGLALGVKDLYDTAFLKTTYGSPIYRNHLPEKDAWLVGRLRALGAHVIGKTVTTEFAWRQAGPTVNPYNERRTPGGSSSGSAAAVAAGIVPLALGTQTFGSIIRPAAFCGVAGFKPSHGQLCLDGVHPLSPSLDHAGYLGRTVGFIGHVHALVMGRPPSGRREAPISLRFVRGPFWREASEGQRRAMLRAAERLRSKGIAVKEAELPEAFDCAVALAETILCREAAGIYRPLIDRWPGHVSAHIVALVTKGEAIADSVYRDALARRDALGERLSEEMGDCEALLTIPALGEAPLLAEGTGDPAPCVPWTLLGVPSAALPQGFGAHGLPLGIQLVGRRDDDFAFLGTCAVVEVLLDEAGREGSGTPDPRALRPA